MPPAAMVMNVKPAQLDLNLETLYACSVQVMNLLKETSAQNVVLIAFSVTRVRINVKCALQVPH